MNRGIPKQGLIVLYPPLALYFNLYSMATKKQVDSIAKRTKFPKRQFGAFFICKIYKMNIKVQVILQVKSIY